jgi:Family of unknown function (DUF6746)
MKNTVLMIATVLFLGHAAVTMAGEKSGHFQGKPAETLGQAMSNFSEYNQKLSSLLNQDNLSPQDMQQVHELTYTLENALNKINATMTKLAETLEAVHLSSETGDAEGTKTEGIRYLDTATQIIQ